MTPHRIPGRVWQAAIVSGLLLAVSLPSTPSQAARSGADYALLPSTQNGTVAWDSCNIIGYRVNRNGVARAEVRRLHQAFDHIEAVTSLRFRYEGRTSVIPMRTFRLADQQATDERTDITIAFAAAGRGPTQSPLWVNSAMLGFGGASTVGTWVDGKWESTMGQGRVILNATGLRRFDGPQRLALYMHELAHVVGLDHTQRPGQVMTPPLLSSTQPQWSAGDRAGLRKLGNAGQPCR